jgi:hypothetical protein
MDFYSIVDWDDDGPKKKTDTSAKKTSSSNNSRQYVVMFLSVRLSLSIQKKNPENHPENNHLSSSSFSSPSALNS